MTDTPGATSDVELQVLAPVATHFGERATPLAPRVSSLEGLRVGLLWNAKPNGDVALRTVGKLLEEQVPGVTTAFYSGSLPCERDLLERVRQESDVVVACTAD